jgi:hypothetical protein
LIAYISSTAFGCNDEWERQQANKMAKEAEYVEVAEVAEVAEVREEIEEAEEAEKPEARVPLVSVLPSLRDPSLL